MQKKKYYAVKKGRNIGIYGTWDECKKQTMGFGGAVYKSFPTEEEALAFINDAADNMKIPDDMDKAVAYVDGSYRNDTKQFSYGAVIFYKGQEYTFSEAFSDEELATMRNVAGEIKGSQRAMQFCVDNGIRAVEIYYDYEGIEKWCRGIWKTNKQGTIAYKKYYDSISSILMVKFVKVKGHSGDKYNDMVDMLAKKALGIEA